MASRPGPSGVSSSCAPSRKGSSASRGSEPSRRSRESGRPSPSASRKRASELEPPPPLEQAASNVEANRTAPKARDGFGIERPSGRGRGLASREYHQGTTPPCGGAGLLLLVP